MALYTLVDTEDSILLGGACTSISTGNNRSGNFVYDNYIIFIHVVFRLLSQLHWPLAV